MKNKLVIIIASIVIAITCVIELSVIIYSQMNSHVSNKEKYASSKTAIESLSAEKLINGPSVPDKIGQKEIKPFTVIPESLKSFSYQISPADKVIANHIQLDGITNYQNFKGISTFRGSNYRQNAFYGELEVNEKKLEKAWTNTVGNTDSWTGVGWNGQPAIVKWDNEVQKSMNLYDEFKNKEDFVEVICGSLDSHVHFYDMETGKPSRDTIYVTSSIKGSVTVDPRGYPLLYVGQGINEVHGKEVRFGYHIFSLIDGKELFFIDGRDKFALVSWGAFDGNPVIDGASDTMILPGENGLVYLVKLNTSWDKENSQISVNPEVTRYRYSNAGRAGGMENAMTVYEHYAFFTNNYGTVQCLDLNTLTPIWSYQMEDDCDSTIGLEEENGEIYLYVACEVDKRARACPAYVKKLNGRTGEVIWEYSTVCQYDGNNNGGVLSSPIIGKGSISNMVIYNFAKVNTLGDGKFVVLDKNNGSVIWEKHLPNYSWSSPVAVYTKNNQAYLVFGDSAGVVHLIDPLTGEFLYSLPTGGGNMEGSPAVYDNHIIIGTRGQRIYRIDIK